MKKSYIILLIGIISIKGYSQSATTPPIEKEWDVSIYGFVRTDYILDTRKTVQVREENLNLYPLDEVLDANGKDINKTVQSNFLSVTSRLGVKAKGPNVWGAKTSAVLEGDFFGNLEGSTIGLFRLRHSYVNLEWSKTTLTMGQTWYPQYIPEVFPGVANFNTGILFNPFGWATQVKLKQMLSKELSLTFVAYKEREFTTPGPGTQNSASINSALPTIHGQIQYKGKNVLMGLGSEYKSLQPLTVSNALATSEKAISSSIFGFAKYSNDKIAIKAYGISGGNLYNLVMLGGYTGKTITGGVETYDPIKTTAFWFDVSSNAKSIAPGIFFGYTKNNGSSDDSATATYINYMRGVSGTRVVDKIWRGSTRVDFKKNKFRISPELEYTVATWGDLIKNNATASTNKKDVNNFRAMVSCVYSF
ncbi:hypothetical protein [Flavobacterium psychrotolerans]|uniref:Porin n=1 Tax=Flavobacterium psychrotolerans TaxID=2169410 RepID=A0A2U1JLD5_9FLAO|nr:hypothetical protein [Flavobacterium psychrotolerans]PWA05794.1 hypothetical protein DB895_05050 [Flavobacterium psychrotolerans]